jgi:hypothetical protein
MKIALLTPVHNRRFTFPIIEHYVKRACDACPGSWDIDWVVVDDGTDPVSPLMGQHYIRLDPFKPAEYSPAKSFIRNVETGLRFIKRLDADYVHFIEDDDWRSYQFLHFFQSLFDSKQYLAVGEGNARYYHLPTGKYHIHTNNQHASLCQTAITREGLELMLDVIKRLNEPTYLLDLLFWKRLQCEHYRLSLNTAYVIGLKGLTPGNGIGAGHCPDWYKQTDDEQRSVLKTWVGDYDARFYLNKSQHQFAA